MRWELSISPFNATGQSLQSLRLIPVLIKASRSLDHLALSFNGGKDCESPPLFSATSLAIPRRSTRH